MSKLMITAAVSASDLVGVAAELASIVSRGYYLSSASAYRGYRHHHSTNLKTPPSAMMIQHLELISNWYAFCV